MENEKIKTSDSITTTDNLFSEEEVETDEVAEEEEEESATSEEDETPEKKPEKKSGVQKRINELVRKQREAEREAAKVGEDRDHWRKETLRLQKLIDDEQKEGLEIGEPKEEDFDTVEEYLTAKMDWKIKQETEKLRKNFDETISRQKEDRKKEIINTKIKEGREKYSDFDEIALSKDVPYNDAMLDIIVNSKRTDDIAYYLGSHLDKTLEIFNMSPLSAAVEIGKIEATLPENPDKVKQKQKKETNAPPPITPIGGSEVLKKSYEDMTYKEYEAIRKKELGIK